MSDLMQCLYHYVLDHMDIKDPEYHQNRHFAELKLKQLVQTLTPEQQALVHEYQAMSYMANTAAKESIFRDTLKLGLYLGSLHHS